MYRVRLILIDMNNREFGPYLAAIYRILISVMGFFCQNFMFTGFVGAASHEQCGTGRWLLSQHLADATKGVWQHKMGLLMGPVHLLSIRIHIDRQTVISYLEWDQRTKEQHCQLRCNGFRTVLCSGCTVLCTVHCIPMVCYGKTNEFRCILLTGTCSSFS
jgi:hypothetical protein